MRKLFLLTILTLVVGFGLWSTKQAEARSIPYNIATIEDFLDDSTYFNGYTERSSSNFEGDWHYTVIAFESSHINWIHEGPGTSATFTTYNTGSFGTYNHVDFGSTNLYFQDSNGPYHVPLDSNTDNNYFRIFTLTEASNALTFLSNDLTLSEGSVIVGFNDNRRPHSLRADADFDDIIVVLVPGETGTLSPIPEPGTMLLLGCGLVGLAGVSRKRFKR